MKLRPANFFSFLFWIVATLVEYLFLANNLNFSYFVVSVVLVFNFVGQLVNYYFLTHKIMTFSVVFIIFYYVFHFGQIIMLGFFPNYQYDYTNYILSYMKDGEVLIKTIVVCLVCINVFFAGVVLLCKPHIKSISSPATGLNKQKWFVFMVKSLFLITFVFRLFLDGLQTVDSLMHGYRTSNALSVSGVVSTIANMWYIYAIFYYLVSNHKRRDIVLITLYIVVSMISGNRGRQITSLCGLYLIAYLFSSPKRLSFGKILGLILISFIGLFVIDIVFEMRSIGFSLFFSSPNIYISAIFKKNIILETIGTFGETIYTPYLVIKSYGKDFSPFFGECFVKSIPSIIPDVFGFFKNTNNEAIFTKTLGSDHALGGSFAGEMYYNFGSLYPLMSALFGAAFEHLNNHLKKHLCSKNISRAFFPAVLCILSLWWVRDSVGNMVREIVWLYFLYFIFSSFFKEKAACISDVKRNCSGI